MKNYSYFILSPSFLCAVFVFFIHDRITAQNNDSLSRNVTVERVYQPIIQTSSKVDLQPEVIEHSSQKSKVVYADSSYTYSETLQMKPIIPSKETFAPPLKQSHGHIAGGIGHADSYFDFLYQIRDNKNSMLDIFIKHNAYWGLKTFSRTALGINFNHGFSASQVYFSIGGDNDFFTYYGRYYDVNNDKENKKIKMNALTSFDKRSLWTINGHIGIKANKWNDFQYKVQIGYRMFRYKSVVEHAILSSAMIGWKGDVHGGGLNVGAENNFYMIDENYIPAENKREKHAFRIEPFYSVTTDRFIAHIGVNIDMNIGSGKMLSANDKISFAPSPNVNFELFITKNWLSFYGQIIGHYTTNSLHTNLKTIRFLNDTMLLTSKHVPEYTPVDGIAGFNIKAHKNFLIDLHIGYAYLKNQKVLITGIYDVAQTTNENSISQTSPFIDFNYMDYTCFKAGLSLSYHYKDKIKIRLNADFNGLTRKSINLNLDSTLTKNKTVYGQPSWIIELQGNFEITKQWSVYTENTLYGTRKALILNNTAINQPTVTTYSEKNLKAFLDINIGVKYSLFKHNLTLFLQLNNILCRHNDMYYTYKTPGINGMFGVMWKF